MTIETMENHISYMRTGYLNNLLAYEVVRRFIEVGCELEVKHWNEGVLIEVKSEEDFHLAREFARKVFGW